MWIPDLSERSSPRYVAIAEALAEDIDRGTLDAGTRLPTHRDLARSLGVTVGTVSRAYAEAERRGLVRGEVGRGTYVQEPSPVSSMPSSVQRFGDPLHEEEGWIDLGPSVAASPLHDEEERVLREAFISLSESSSLSSLLECQPHAGMGPHREAASAWLREIGLSVPASRILVTSGGQHAMAVAFATLARPGDVVMTEAVTFPGMKGLASLMHLRLQGLEMDSAGILPEAFDRACRKTGSKVLYTIPTQQNPTATVMPESRRLELVEVARRHEVSIVEDDVYGFLPLERPPALATLAPDIVYAVHSVSKITVPGLRVGFLVAPEAMVDRLGAGIWATTWMASPPMAEIVSQWIQDGTIRRFQAWRREEAAVRNEMARRILVGRDFVSDPHGFFLWLTMPEPWCANDLVRQAKKRGVLVSTPEVFVAGRGQVPHAVRVSLAAIHDRKRLEEGLGILAELLAEPPEPCVCVA